MHSNIYIQLTSYALILKTFDSVDCNAYLYCCTATFQTKNLGEQSSKLRSAHRQIGLRSCCLTNNTKQAKNALVSTRGAGQQ